MMKGTVPRPQWPAPAKTATQKTATQTSDDERTAKPLSPITLALLDEYSNEGTQGYDPYNASASRRSVATEAWKRRTKR